MFPHAHSLINNTINCESFLFNWTGTFGEAHEKSAKDSLKKELLPKLTKTKQVWFDIAMLEGVGGIGNLLKDVPADQIVFGSHAPFFYLESSLLKLRESSLSDRQLRLVQHANAQGVLIPGLRAA